ncbi:DEAD/DEAH box helicase [Geminicoccus roseus]|uniref:DEAD/DEAH box helicase n=1 Tax=Geminicoccus roseus TaxID=404900 RepID=UPI000A022D74|nr:DEAD/DEAH box helicase [Geminicoccus roseus]
MAFKAPPISSSVPDSPDKLFRDLPRRTHPSLFDHQGQMLRAYHADAQNEPDVALQLPTGSGKTLVGLLLAEWRRRKYNEKVVYLCPTRQLVNQVVEEATKKYGIAVENMAGPVRELSQEAKGAYSNAERIAVTTFNGLFNSNPFFRNPDVIIIDDAHASEQYIASHWTVTIDRFNTDDANLFAAVSSVLKSVLDDVSYTRLTGHWDNVDDKFWVDKLPTNQLLTIQEELRSVINANINGNEQKYSWRMISDHLTSCHIYVGSSQVLLRPLIPPTWSHAPFENATQRVYMSATLGAGGDLERLTGRTKIKRLPIPDGWDKQGIGRRFFIFPERSLKDDAILRLRHSLMNAAGRSLVLSPSNATADAVRADVNSSLGFPTMGANDIEATKTPFTSLPKAVAVVANRYDGIDFPGDDCRLLFVEGLPRATNLQERFLMNRMGAQLLFNERVQTRVLQAVGRCTRGLNDYSAVVVTGEELPDYLTNPKRRSYFHPELQAELEFGINQSTQVDNSDIVENFRIFIEHGVDWEQANQQIIDARAVATQISFPAMDQLDSAVAYEVKYQQRMWQGDHVQALDHAREVLGKLNDPLLRGYRALWHYLAGSAAEIAVREGHTNLEQPARAQFRSAKEAAKGIPWMVKLSHGTDAVESREEMQNSITMLQIEQLESNLVRLGTITNRSFTERENAIRTGINSSNDFEQAQVLLGRHLGFSVGKRESDASPDPWWIVENICIVFEDHADAKPVGAQVDATKARQAASHPDWIRSNLPEAKSASIISVLVTPAKTALVGALPSLSRVSYWDLDEFRVWAEAVLQTVRELRRKFVEPGDLDWRAQAAAALVACGADAPSLFANLSCRIASTHLSSA